MNNQSPYIKAYEAGIKLAWLEHFSKHSASSKKGYPEKKPLPLFDPKDNRPPPKSKAYPSNKSKDLFKLDENKKQAHLNEWFSKYSNSLQAIK